MYKSDNGKFPDSKRIKSKTKASKGLQQRTLGSNQEPPRASRYKSNRL